MLRSPGVVGLLLALVSQAQPVGAQELTPRAYWPAPNGTRLLVAGYAYSSGDVVTDPSLPVTGVDSSLNTALFGYFHTTELFGRTANVVFELPYVWGTTRGRLDGEPAMRELSNLGDLAVTLGINLLGGPTMTAEEFRAMLEKPGPILGASLKILAPTGDYEKDRLINVSGNRWAAKAELGYIYPYNERWHFELEGGIWVFGNNDEFLGTTRRQDPVLSAEFHVVRHLGKGRWLSFEANFFEGGETTVDGVGRDDLQRNSNVGATLAWPLGNRQVLKVGVNGGVVTRSGGDYNTVLVTYLVGLP